VRGESAITGKGAFAITALVLEFLPSPFGTDFLALNKHGRDAGSQIVTLRVRYYLWSYSVNISLLHVKWERYFRIPTGTRQTPKHP
jgi:hypothetical protein